MSNRHFGAARPKVSGAASMEPPAMSDGEIAAAKAAAEHKMEVENDPAYQLEIEQARHKAQLDQEENAYVVAVAASGALAEEGEIAPPPEPGQYAQLGWDANPAEGRVLEDGDYNMFVAAAVSAVDEEAVQSETSPVFDVAPPGFFKDMQGSLWLIDLIGGLEVRPRADVGHGACDLVAHTAYGERTLFHTASLASALKAQEQAALMIGMHYGLIDASEETVEAPASS